MRLLHLIPLGLLLASLLSATPLTSITLGNAASEKAAALVATSAPIEQKPDVALGEPGRRLVPASEDAAASLAFDVKLDPVAQNYLTLRIWGSDTTWTPVHLFTDADSVNLGNLWWHVTREAPVPGRFLYRTFPIPIEVTRGKTSLRLRLQTAAAPQNIGAFRNADQPPPKLLYRPSFALYGLHAHTDSWFEPPVSERQGPPFVWGPPAPKPADYPDTAEQRLLERARVDIKRALDYNVVRSQYGTGHRYDIRVLDTLSLIYNTEWSGHYRDKAVAERVRDAIDVNVLRQAAEGDPGKMFYRGWGAHGGIAHAYSQIHDTFAAAGWLDEPLTVQTASGPVTLTRRQAYGDFFHDAFEWRRLDRRSWTNQPIYVSHTLYRLQAALRALGDPRALTKAQSLGYVHEAIGLRPLRSRTFALDAADAGYPYYLITRAGLTREKGYVDGYGELTYVLVRIAEETGDPAVRALTEKFLKTRSVFRIPTNDTAGNGALRGIGAISWRGTTFPFRVAYSGIEEAAILDGDPVALRLAQLEIAHGRLNLLEPEPPRGPHWGPDTSIRLYDQYLKIKDLPPSPYRLPAEPGQPDFVWSDPESGVFVFRHGADLVYGSFFNLDLFNARAVGDRGILHRIRAERESLVEFPVEFDQPESGLSLTIKYPFGERTRPQTPPPPGMTKWQTEPPEASDHRIGRAYFYHTRTGPYVIAMNTTETGTYRESIWTLPAIPGAKKAIDLATGEIVDLSKPLAIPAYTTRVFILE